MGGLTDKYARGSHTPSLSHVSWLYSLAKAMSWAISWGGVKSGQQRISVPGMPIWEWMLTKPRGASKRIHLFCLLDWGQQLQTDETFLTQAHTVMSVTLSAIGLICAHILLHRNYSMPPLAPLHCKPRLPCLFLPNYLDTGSKSCRKQKLHQCCLTQSVHHLREQQFNCAGTQVAIAMCSRKLGEKKLFNQLLKHCM